MLKYIYDYDYNLLLLGAQHVKDSTVTPSLKKKIL